MHKAAIIHREPWSFVKEVDGGDGTALYDVWWWNVYKLKWVRAKNTACGFGEAQDAIACSKEMSDETQTMLDRNRTPPEPYYLER